MRPAQIVKCHPDRRYPVEAELSYRTVRHGQVIQNGRGRTVFLSSSDLSFESPSHPPPDTEIELLITWPVRFAGTYRLQLCATGRTVRTEGKRTEVQIQRCEFRTLGNSQDLATTA
jgi:hypothetical protein